jgi:hypothetical protein
MNANVNIQCVIFQNGCLVVLSEKAKEALAKGELKIRVNRNGIFQWVTFKIRIAKLGNLEYYELFSEKIIGLSELMKIAEEMGLPASAPNGNAFPKGTGAADFKKTD